jgi:aryl-alcohol dehydrogenase-like predicted oxidoreductase
MRTHRLGSQGPELSVIGYGSWEAGGTAWGPNGSDEAVIDAMRAALDAGVNWIDTAEVYGDGVSESLVGRAIAGRHDEVVVASKVAPEPEGSGFRPEQIRKACEASLSRLGVEAIDLYQLHWPDEMGMPVEESWGAMAELQEAGKVRFLGVSNFDQSSIERCEPIRHVDSLQPEFSMLDRRQADLIAWCGEQGTGVVSYGPLGYGLLTGAIDAGTTYAEGDWRATSNEPDDPGELNLFAHDVLPEVLAVVERLRPIAARVGSTLAQLALAWNVHQPGVTSAIAGSRNPSHVRSNAVAGDLALDAGTLAELDHLLDEAAIATR